MRQTRGLLDEPPMLLQPSLAKAIGLSEAVVVQQLHYWLVENEKKNRNYIKGRYWTYNTLTQWQEHFSFFSVPGLKKVFARLRQLGVVDSERLNPDRRNRTAYLTLNYERIDELLEMAAREQSSGTQKVPCKSPKRSHIYKETETTTEKGESEVSEVDGADENGQPQAGEDEHELLRPERIADDFTAFATMPVDEYVRGLEADGVEHLARNPYRPGLPVSATSTQRCPARWRSEGSMTKHFYANTQLKAKAASAMFPAVQRPGPKHSLRIGGGYMTGAKSLVARMRRVQVQKVRSELPAFALKDQCALVLA